MSALKKIAGLVVGVSAVGAIGVAVAQGVPPNPRVSNPALGAGEQSSYGTLIGETGVLPWSDAYVQQTATLTKQPEQAAVASQPAPEPQQPVASSSTTTESTTVAQAPASSDNTQSMGAPSAEPPQPAHTARADRG